jgi:hypothetical protein
LLRCAVLEILMYLKYIPVSALRAPCTQAARYGFANCLFHVAGAGIIPMRLRHFAVSIPGIERHVH